MTRASLFFASLALVFLAASAEAQSLPGVTQAQTDAALEDLSALYGSPVVRIDQAKAICNEEQYVVECARIGKKHGLYPKERAKQVDTMLTQFKNDVVEKMKACDSTECLVDVATTISKNLNKTDPALAKELDLTPQKVEEKREIVETAKAIGVDIEECRSMDPDTASVELLRACARLARSEHIQKYIPEGDRTKVEKSDKTIALKEALQRGELSCGDGTLEGCGTFCLNPGARTQEGTDTIPQICRDIASRFFGPEGIAELERAHGTVQGHIEAVREYQKSEPERPNIETPVPGERPTRRLACPKVDYAPCTAGEYRQESQNEFGCFVASECMPFNTKTQKESPDERIICPALHSVMTCPTGEEKVVSYSSPECGTYHSCKPIAREDTFIKYPYTFGSGRVVVSFDEARMYCYESGSHGATVRGDKAACQSIFGITVPETPKSKRCAEYGEDWSSVDESGNCFNRSMTEYVNPNGVLRACSEQPVFGCTNYMTDGDRYKGGAGQKEQQWNNLGLRSWIRADADASRIESLKQACSNVRSQSNIWTTSGGDSSSKDFGMPDAEKCRKASSCSSTQYFNGSECASGGNWQTCKAEEYWDGKACVSKDVSGTCSSDLISLLGNGCHSRGNAWFNNTLTMYVFPGTKTVKSCASDYISGCSGGVAPGTNPQCSDGKDNDSDGQTDYPSDSGCSGADDWDEAYSTGGSGKMQTWNSYGLSSMIRNDADPARIASLKQACANVKSQSANVWTSGSGSYTEKDFGMPDPDKCAKAAACTSDQTFNGTSCSGGSTSSGSMRRCFYSNATKNGQPVGYSVWCESDQYNCHEGSPSGAAISLTGVSLGSPSSCEGNAPSGGPCSGFTEASCIAESGCRWENSRCMSSGSYNSSSAQQGCASAGGTWDSAANYCKMPGSSGSTSCGSGYYWNGSSCVSSGSSSGSGSSSCGSGYYWNGSMCVSSSSGSGSSSSYDYSSMQQGCASAGGTWNSSSNYCQMPNSSSSSYNSSSAEQGCASAGGTWDSAAGYCRMPTSAIDPKLFAFACPEGNSWNGSSCTSLPESNLAKFVASAFSAFSSLFGF